MKIANALKSAVGGVLALATGSAFAAVPAEVSAAINDAGADAATIGGLVLVVIVGIAAFKYMRRAI